MNILIDAHFLDKKKEGNRTFILNQIKGFDRLFSQNINSSDLKIHSCVYNKENWAKEFSKSNFEWINCSKFSIIRYLFNFPRTIRKKKIDIIQTIYHLPLFIPKRVKKVLVVHDILPFTNPELFKKIFLIRFKLLLKYSLRKADKIVCGSELTKQMILKYFPEQEKKIDIVNYGIDSNAIEVNKEEADSFLKKKKITVPYMLYVGRLDKRKNLKLLFDLAELSKKQIDLKIVIVGRKENIKKETERQMERLISENLILYLNEISDKNLNYLYKNAAVLLLFSEYEGFGYPIFEAINFEIPFLCASDFGIDKIDVSNAIINLNDKNDILEKIKNIINNKMINPSLKKKRKIIMDHYSLDIFAKNFVNLYISIS